MTTMTTDLQENQKLCNLSKSIGESSVDLDEVATLASKASSQLANRNDNASAQQLATTARDIWSRTKKISCPQTPDNQYLDDEIMASLIMTDYMPDAPDEAARADEAAKSAARGLALLCRLMAERFVEIGQS